MASAPTEKEALTVLYQETVRLANLCDGYARGAFDDVKLLAAVGGIVGWKPLHDALGLGTEGDPTVLFLGFVAIVLVLGVIGLMNLQKQVVIHFYLEELQLYETEIRKLLGRPGMAAFRVAEHWHSRAVPRHRKVGAAFYLLFYLSALAPLAVLDLWTAPYLGLQYLGVALLVIALHLRASWVTYRPALHRVEEGR